MSAAPGTRNANRNGIAPGVAVMAIFSLIWAIVGVSGAAPNALVGVSLALVVTAITIAVTAIALRLATRSADRGATRRVSPNARRDFHLVNAGQAALILIAVFGLVKVGAAALVPAAVCLVVGLHFLPLARVFDVSAYRLTGALLVAVAVVGAVVFAFDADDGLARSVVGFPAALVLWFTGLLIAKRG